MMDRFYRRILCLMIFSLLVSAGGIAPSQTLSTFMVFDSLVTGAPIKSHHTERLQAAYSVANRPKIVLTRPVRLPAAVQCCLKGRALSMARQTMPRYLAPSFSYTSYYSETLSPPPRTLAAI